MAMWSGQSLYVNDVLESVDKNLWELECYAEFRTENKEYDPPQRMRFANVKATFNTMDSQLAKLSEVAKRLPRKKKNARANLLAEETDDEPGEYFQDLLGPKVEAIIQIAMKIGGDVYDQALALEEAFDAQVEVIAYSSTVAKPSQDELLERFKALISAKDDAVDYRWECEVQDPLNSHYRAVADCATMLGWVLAPDATKFVEEHLPIVKLECDNMLSNYLLLQCDPLHSDYAEAIRTLSQELVSYVKKKHPICLRWNYAKGAAPEGYRVKRKVKARKDAHPFLDFLEIVDGPLLEFVYCSQIFGDPLYNQARLLFEAFMELYKLITRVSAVGKPSDGKAFDMYKMPVRLAIEAVGSCKHEVDREHKFYRHLWVVAEVAEVLQWVDSTELTAAMYVTELSGASEMALNRILKFVEGGTSYAYHKAWADSLRALLNDMKVYVTIHHYKELSTNTKYDVDEVPGLWRQRDRNVKLRQMKIENKDKTRHWTPEMRYLWGTGIIDRPFRNSRAARRQRIK